MLASPWVLRGQLLPKKLQATISVGDLAGKKFLGYT
jgi:hypothetical protein